MKYASLLAGLLMLVSTVERVQGQALPASRNHIAGWHNAGFPGEPWAPDRIVNVRDFGALGNGVANDLPSIQAAMNSLGTEGGVVFFPAGIYCIPDNSFDLNANIVLRGERSSTTEIRITNHVAGQFHAIKISGTTSGGWITVDSGYNKFSQTIAVSDVSGFSAGDYAQIRMGTNVAWKMSSWAQNSIGQIVRIQSVNTTVAPAGTITLVTPLRQQFYPNQQIDGVPVPVGIQKILPKKNVGIENLKIGRTVSSSGSGNDNAFTIWFNYATECWVRGCEISNFLGAAIACEYSANNKFSGNFIDSPFEVDGGGSGYGITYQFRSSENLAENNIFRKNRHSMVVQIGANGNVFGWNYSREQKRTEYPSSASQDTIIHGNWAGANLFEGNCAANNTIDASSGHGINAPDNFLFRNRYRQSGLGCGMYWTDSSSDQSFVGNEIVGTISISKTGKFEYGDLKGTTATPSGFSTLADVSYYWGTNVFSPPIPSWWNITNNPPTIGLPFNANTANEVDIPARNRWNSGAPYTYAPPSISGQPASAAVTVGAGALFTVVAAGTPTVQYKWYKNGVEIPGAVSASYAIASAQPADAGQYKVMVSDARGRMFSATSTLTVNGATLPPTAPSGLTASVASSSQINLSWVDNASNETGYKIERSLTAGGGFTQIATVGANVTSYQDAGVTAGTVYYYRVRANNAGGDSGYSNEATATTSAGTGLVAHWKLDETSGTTAADFSGYGNSATLVNGPTWGTGVVGGAVQLAAGSQYIVANNVAVNTAGGGCNTVAFWMKWDGTENQMPFGWNGLYDLWFYGGAFGINTAQSDIFGIASTGLAGQWVHVAVVFPNGAPSAANAKIYINGILQAASQQLGSSTSRSATPGVLISGWGNDGNYKFGGAIDDVRIYDHELSAAEVGALASINGLPSPWATQDIGAVGVAGSASHAGGVYTINGSGADIWGTADGFRYVYQVGSGDCDIRARVTAVGNTDPWAKAGVMIRDGLSAGAMFADMVMTPGTGGSSFQYRAATGVDCGYGQVGGVSAPYWVRVVRSGNDFTGYMSPDGTAWTQVGGAQTMAMGATTYIGLAVTAHNNASLCTATLDNVTVAP